MRTGRKEKGVYHLRVKLGNCGDQAIHAKSVQKLVTDKKSENYRMRCSQLIMDNHYEMQYVGVFFRLCQIVKSKITKSRFTP